MVEVQLTGRQREILEVIEAHMREHGYPPSVREIGEAVGLASTSTVHAHLASLQRMGYLRRDPSKPRAIEVRFDPGSGAAFERRDRVLKVRRRRIAGDLFNFGELLGHSGLERRFEERNLDTIEWRNAAIGAFSLCEQRIVVGIQVHCTRIVI